MGLMVERGERWDGSGFRVVRIRDMRHALRMYLPVGPAAFLIPIVGRHRHPGSLSSRRPPIARLPPRIPPFPPHPQVIGARGDTYRRPNRIQKPWSGCKCGVLLRGELFREM